jgi:hypothetical protein
MNDTMSLPEACEIVEADLINDGRTVQDLIHQITDFLRKTGLEGRIPASDAENLRDLLIARHPEEQRVLH